MQGRLEIGAAAQEHALAVEVEALDRIAARGADRRRTLFLATLNILMCKSGATDWTQQALAELKERRAMRKK